MCVCVCVFVCVCVCCCKFLESSHQGHLTQARSTQFHSFTSFIQHLRLYGGRPDSRHLALTKHSVVQPAHTHHYSCQCWIIFQVQAKWQHETKMGFLAARSRGQAPAWWMIERNPELQSTGLCETSSAHKRGEEQGEGISQAQSNKKGHCDRGCDTVTQAYLSRQRNASILFSY